MQKCAAPFEAGKKQTPAVFDDGQFHALFTAYNSSFFMIQNFIINIGSQAGFEIDRTAALHDAVRGGRPLFYF